MNGQSIDYQFEQAGSEYTQVRDVVGFYNPELDPKNSNLSLKEQYNIYAKIESEKIHEAEGKSTNSKHRIFDITNHYLHHKLDIPLCPCHEIDECDQQVVCHTRDMSEDCYQTECFTFCERYKKVYHPISMLLCLIGERNRANPDGPITPREIFKLWVELDACFTLPNIAIKWFAKKESIAAENTFIQKTSEQGTSYSILPEDLYYKVISLIESKYDIEINKNTIYIDPYESESESDIESKSDETENPSDPDEYNENTDDHSDSRPEQKADSDQFKDEYIDKANDKDLESTGIQTYKEPNLDTPGIDVDINAVAQFIEHHATVQAKDGEELLTDCNTLLKSFTEWSKINNIDLKKLRTDRAENNRKGSMKSILNDGWDIEKKQRRINGHHTRVYVGIELSEEICKLE